MNTPIRTPVIKKTMRSFSWGSLEKEPAPRMHIRETDLLTEETFRELLSFERKRSERSKTPLLLMLLDISGIRNPDERYTIIRHSVLAVASAWPEVPIKGWYERDSIFGVVFVDAPETLQKTLHDTMSRNIPPAFQRTGLLRLAFYSFPGSERLPHGSGNANTASGSLFYPEITAKEKKRRLACLLKRTLDIAGGLAGILLFSPLFIAIPLFIKTTSKGPVLFRQERVGQNGRKFVFLKFRTMFTGNNPGIHQDYIKKFIQEKKSYEAGPQKGPIYKIKDDPRVTRVGRFLRKTSLDELPQFFNVLRGDMSLVGPRPPIPYELEHYKLWHRRRVMEVKPGITGLWQVSGRSSTTFDEMVRLDLKYAKEWSLLMDVRIILKTPWVVLTGKGGY